MRVKNLGEIGYPNYEVSDEGDVYSLNYRGNTGKRQKMTPRTNKVSPYLQIILCSNGIKKHFYIHYLVARAFLGDWSMWGLDQVNHKDENPRNNRLENLEWCTGKYNCNYGTRNERLSDKSSRKINQYTLDGTFIQSFNSLGEAERITGISRPSITRCLRGKNKSAGNYFWKYDDPDLYSKHNINYGTTKEGKRISQFSKEGTFMQSFVSMNDAERLTGIDRRCISKCCRGQRKTAGGFVWRYKID